MVDDDDQGPRSVAPRRRQRSRSSTEKADRAARRFQRTAGGRTALRAERSAAQHLDRTSGTALDAIARRHRLTRLETQDFTLTRRRIARLRINDGRPVATVIRSLQAEARILGAQPNYLFAVQQGAAATTAAGPAQYSLAKLRLTEAHALANGASVLVAVIDTTIDATPSRSRRRRRRLVRRDRHRRQAARARHRDRERDRRARKAHRRGAGREGARRPRVRLGRLRAAPA